MTARSVKQLEGRSSTMSFLWHGVVSSATSPGCIWSLRNLIFVWYRG